MHASRTNRAKAARSRRLTPGHPCPRAIPDLNCRILERCAEILGEDAAFWRDTAERIRRAMLEKWYDPETARIATGSEGCQALRAVAENHSRTGRAARGKSCCATTWLRAMTDSPPAIWTTLYMLEMLTEYGYVNEAWNLITREDHPSYGFMIEQESATTVWERFELKKVPETNSHSHPMFRLDRQMAAGCRSAACTRPARAGRNSRCARASSRKRPDERADRV